MAVAECPLENVARHVLRVGPIADPIRDIGVHAPDERLRFGQGIDSEDPRHLASRSGSGERVQAGRLGESPFSGTAVARSGEPKPELPVAWVSVDRLPEARM